MDLDTLKRQLAEREARTTDPDCLRRLTEVRTCPHWNETGLRTLLAYVDAKGNDGG